jgi:hypothetical protein
MFCQIVYIVISFICRTIFTKILGAEYLGINGLFSNILTMLSFVELGMGSALVYKMYKPLKEKDEHQLCIYMNFYKKVYTWIAVIVALIGLSMVPFLNDIVEAPDLDLNIRVIYVLYLADTVISYLYVYKKSILIADQKNYVVAVYTQIFNIIMNVLQILILLCTYNFIHYLLIKILCDWLNNVFCSKRASKDYPYIDNKTVEGISDADKAELKKDIKGLLLGKIASVAFDGTDNIFISEFAGIASVGIVSNYTLILSTFNGLLNHVFSSLTSSIGQFSVDMDPRTVEKLMKKIYFANVILYGYLFIGMTLLLKTFVMDIWVGKEYVLSDITVFLLIVELSLRGIHFPLYITRTAMGLFGQMAWMGPVGAFINICLDVVLGRYYGIAGIIMATIIARILTRTADVYVLYKCKFQKTMMSYYAMHIKYLLFILLCTGVCGVCLDVLTGMPAIGRFIFGIAIISVIYVGLVVVVFRNSEEFKYYFTMVRDKCRGKDV